MSINVFTDYPLSWRPDREKLHRPIYLSLIEQMQDDIKTGKLLPGTKLPSQRELADFLDIGFSTVTRAYKVSQQQGITYGKVGQGTFIANNIDIPLTITRNNTVDVAELGFIASYESTNHLAEKAIREVGKESKLARLLNYDSPTGLDSHKIIATRYLRQVGMTSNPQNTVIVSGGENALTIALLSLFKSGERIAVDRFTYANFIGLAQMRGIKLVPIEDDGDGMLPQDLQRACQQQEIKGIYLMPDFANPTTITMSNQRRHDLAEMIQRLGLILIEDDYLSFANLYRETPLVKISMLVPERSVYVASMSKPLVSGLRVAFFRFSDCFKSKIEDAMFNINVKTSSLDAEVVARLLENGQAERIMQQKLVLATQSSDTFDKVFGNRQPATNDNGWSFFRLLPINGSRAGRQVEQQLLKSGIRVFHSDRFIVGHYHPNEQRFLRVSLAAIDDQQELTAALYQLKKLLVKEGEI